MSKKKTRTTLDRYKDAKWKFKFSGHNEWLCYRFDDLNLALFKKSEKGVWPNAPYGYFSKLDRVLYAIAHYEATSRPADTLTATLKNFHDIKNELLDLKGELQPETS